MAKLISIIVVIALVLWLLPLLWGLLKIIIIVAIVAYFVNLFMK